MRKDCSGILLLEVGPFRAWPANGVEMGVVMEADDRQDSLFRRAREGDSRAFESLLQSCREDLEKYVRARIGEQLRSKVDAEDVIQETCVQALESVRRLKWTGKDTFVRWLKGIARHVLLKQVEKAGRSQLIYLARERRSEDPSPSRALRQRERFDRLKDAVDRLPLDYRHAVVLVRLKGLQINKAAEQMGRTPKAVMHLLSRGLKRLKELLAETESLSLPPRLLEEDEGNEV
jgi:RNA polymerase sigma-70 factor, ECF subfamily